jgi:serine phosphatase RsbU (regulator of sigma subunit)
LLAVAGSERAGGGHALERAHAAASDDAGAPPAASRADPAGQEHTPGPPADHAPRGDHAEHAASLTTSSTAALGYSARWRPSRAAAGAFAAGLLVTAALALTALALYERNERRLLNLRVRQLGLVLSSTAPSRQTPLASAAALADATHGDARRFRALVAPYVGLGRTFASISLWPLGGTAPRPAAVVGAKPGLASTPQAARRFFAGIARPGVLHVAAFLQAARPAVGFGLAAPGAKPGWAVYAENPLPADRRSRLESNSAFADLDYALYFGHSKRARDVLVTSERRLPVGGRTATTVVPFGDRAFTLVVAARGTLGGTFFRDLPWIIAIGGLLLSLAATALTDRLVHGRRRAEQLAGILDRVAVESQHMYTEQRSISQTLQHALLPDTLPQVPGVDVHARYVPAASGVDVGGDWYDVIAVGERRMFLVIGDVSGHGLRAATIMALVRHATLAYVAQDPSPATVLTKLSDFVNSTSHDYFATVLCALIDVHAHTLALASAGHMAPLVFRAGHGEYADCEANMPIGVARTAPFHETTVSVSPGSTLLAFTDGLVERRGEVLDTGLARLRAFATSHSLPLDGLLARLASEMTARDHHDDTAIVGIQWLS